MDRLCALEKRRKPDPGLGTLRLGARNRGDEQPQVSVARILVLTRGST
jgi:hypothetical protein